MDIETIRYLLNRLQDADVMVCIVGEFALNYYYVARIVHDLEICVPKADVAKANSIFTSEYDLLELAVEEYNIFTEYKRGFPRFRSLQEPQFHIVLFTDTFLYLDPLHDSITPLCKQGQEVEYSEEILDLLSIDEIAALPMPRLAPFFKGSCRRYCASKDAVSAIAAEQLVDGMDINESWCRSHLAGIDSEVLSFALALVAGKRSRLSDFSPNIVTCFIATEEEVERLHRIPGASDHTISVP